MFQKGGANCVAQNSVRKLEASMRVSKSAGKPAAHTNSAARAAVTKPLPPPPRARAKDSFSSQGPSAVASPAAAVAPKRYMKAADGTPVVPQQEAGDYYCEHTCWALNDEAKKPTSSVVKDASGKPLAGFLHLPGQLDAPGPKRHQATQQVVGAAFRGYTDTIRGQNPKTDPVKLQLTGYGAFPGVADNPTGDFVSDTRNVDAAMRSGFGEAVSVPGKSVATPAGRAIEYQVKDAKTGKPYAVQVLAKRLEVSDKAIDSSKGSVQDLLKTFRPQAAISLGVDPGASEFEVVVRADQGKLAHNADGTLRHDDTAVQTPTQQKATEISNDALGQAIAAGDRAVRQRDSATRPRS